MKYVGKAEKGGARDFGISVFGVLGDGRGEWCMYMLHRKSMKCSGTSIVVKKGSRSCLIETIWSGAGRGSFKKQFPLPLSFLVFLMRGVSAESYNFQWVGLTTLSKPPAGAWG